MLIKTKKPGFLNPHNRFSHKSPVNPILYSLSMTKTQRTIPHPQFAHTRPTQFNTHPIIMHVIEHPHRGAHQQSNQHNPLHTHTTTTTTTGPAPETTNTTLVFAWLHRHLLATPRQNIYYVAVTHRVTHITFACVIPK